MDCPKCGKRMKAVSNSSYRCFHGCLDYAKADYVKVIRLKETGKIEILSNIPKVSQRLMEEQEMINSLVRIILTLTTEKRDCYALA